MSIPRSSRTCCPGSNGTRGPDLPSRIAVLAGACWLGCALAAPADPATANRLNSEGVQLYVQGDYPAAEKKFDEAIAEAGNDPIVAVMYGNRGKARAFQARNTPALEDLGRALDLVRTSKETVPPTCEDWMSMRCMILTQLYRWQEAHDAAEELLRHFPGHRVSLSRRAWCAAYLGRIDDSVRSLRELMATEPDVASNLADVQLLQGDLEGAIATSQTAGVQPRAALELLLARVQAECDLGRLDEALKHVREIQVNPNTLENVLAQAYIRATAGYFKYDFDEAKRLYDDIEARSDLVIAIELKGRLFFHAERYVDCRDYLSTRAVPTSFACQFWLGAALWKLERFEEARAALTDARRLNPYVMNWARRVPGLDAFVAPIDERITAERGGESGRRLRYELATHLLSVAEIETLVRRYEFARAAGEYGKLLPSLVSAVRRKEVETRLAEVKGMASALDKLVLAVNARKVKLSVKVAGQDLTVVKADSRAFEFTFPQGSGKFPWAYLDPLDFFRFANPQAGTPEERFALGVLLWDVGEAKSAQQNLDTASKGNAALKGRIDGLVARKRGVAAPKGGFVLYKGTYVTPEEKTNLEKGLVRYQGQWVTPADREKLAKGLIQVGGKWVDGDERKLLAAGYRRYKDQWMGAEDYEALRAQWETACEEETEHFRIRTNAGEGFAKDLASLSEAAWIELRSFYDGREPKLGKEKLTLYAFRAYEDYRKYCVERKAEEQLNAAGFASSDSNVVVGWNKTGNHGQLLQTMIHEAAHLYYFRICSPRDLPSWHAEAMATYFEGFKGAGAAWKFNFISDSRLAFAREAMLEKKHLSLKELLAGEALKLINSDSVKANLFYAECWALNYYLTQTDNAAYRDGYKAYRTAIELGKNEPLSKHIPDLDRLEKDWVVFITSQ